MKWTIQKTKRKIMDFVNAEHLKYIANQNAIVFASVNKENALQNVIVSFWIAITATNKGMTNSNNTSKQ